MIWAAFVLLVLFILAFDLGLFSRGERKALTARAALIRTGIYFCLIVSLCDVVVQGQLINGVCRASLSLISTC